MPNADAHSKGDKKPLILRAWKQIVGFLAVCGLVWGVLEGVYFFTEQWHDYTILKENVDSLKHGDERYEKRIFELENYVANKRLSFAVGFRVFKETDEETGITNKVKKYRDWDGKWHTVFRDKEYSDIYGVDYYYYIDKETDERIYCW